MTQIVMFTERLDQLVAQADTISTSRAYRSPGVIGGPTLNRESFQQWKTSSENLIERICGRGSTYYTNFVKETSRGAYPSHVSSGKGILLAIKDDIESGVIPPSARSHSLDSSAISEVEITSNVISVSIQEEIYNHIKQYLDHKDYFHAVEESYKVVREKLREITGEEKATEIFTMNAQSNKYHGAIFGRNAEPGTPEDDFYRGVGYLNLTIQFLRNEKSHSLATTVDKNLALHYISLASLAYDLISRDGDNKKA